MSDTTNTNNQQPLLLSTRQAAQLLGISVWSLNNLVRKKLIRNVEGFKKCRRFSEREILRYAWNIAK
jgi:hypothetical protein